jgi:threonine dehydrogenase-like Zn-dependent dehydrogenase
MRAIYVEKNLPRMLAVKALRPIWPGVIWSPLSPAKIVDLPLPSLPGPKWLRVHNERCGICASDLSLLNVKVDPVVAPAALPGNSRFYLGHEVVGRVAEVGEEVTRFKTGDRVVMESRFAGPNCHSQGIEPVCRQCASGRERLCENASEGMGPVGIGGGWGDGYTAHESEVWPVPDDLSDDQAAMIEPASVALHGVLRRPPKAGEHALVLGAGVIGLLTLAAAKVVEPKAQVSIMARYPHQAEAAQKLGADHILSDRNPYESVAARTGGKLYRAPMNRGMILGGFDVIYDCVGSAETILDSLRWTRAGGAVVMVGISLGALKVDLNPVWYQEVDLLGSHTFGMENWRGQERHSFDWVIEMFQEGLIHPEELITHRFDLERVKEAIRVAQDKSQQSIKVMIHLDQEPA